MHSKHHHQKQLSHKTAKHSGKVNLEILNQTRNKQHLYDTQRKLTKKQQQLLKFNQYLEEFSFDKDLPPERKITADERLEIILALSSTLLCSLNYQQMITFLFTLLICGSYASTSFSEIKNYDSKLVIKEQIYRQICTDKSKMTYNKPNITVGFFNSDIYPKSCMSKVKEPCTLELTKLKNFNYNHNHLQVRKISEQKALKWMEEARIQFMSIIKNLNVKEKIIFNEYFSSLGILKLNYYAAKTSGEWSGGFCSEFTASSLISLLKMKLKYKLDMKIQTVSVSNRLSQSRYIRDHIYLLLDSNIDDIEIFNNSSLVEKALDKITQGKICDAWNKGYYIDFNKDDSGLYDHQAQWDTLQIETFNLKFSKLEQLPPIAQQFICKKLSEMNLDIESGFHCRVFNSNPKSDTFESHQKTTFKSSL